MKTKQVKYSEAVARNAKYRANYLLEAAEKGLCGDNAQRFADYKQGIAGGYAFIKKA